MAAGNSADTAHLYEGKTVRSGAPSRKKLAGKMSSSGSEVPKDAIPEVHIPTFVESLFGGPLVPKMKFLPADRMGPDIAIGWWWTEAVTRSVDLLGHTRRRYILEWICTLDWI